MAIIDKPSDYFNTILYSGTGNENARTGVNFQPDWVWIKQRNGSTNQMLTDSVRGATKTLHSQNTDTESTDAQALKSFNSDGFTVGTDGDVNTSSDTYVAWNWLAGTSFTNDASATGIGTIDSTGSASDTSGFSIVSYTGTGSAGTIKHGLNSAPNMIIQKNRDETQPWWVWHSSLTGANSYLRLNGTNAEGTDGAALWNSTLPTSSVFSVGDNTGINGSADKCIAYCFNDVQGYSKFGSYTGNGNADGPFVYTGFKPAFVMVKLSSGADDWQVLDNKRSPINIVGGYLRPNSSGATVSNDVIDFLSNGFKLRASSGSWNANGSTFIFMAFAENPFVTSTSNGSIPATAR